MFWLRAIYLSSKLSAGSHLPNTFSHFIVCSTTRSKHTIIKLPFTRVTHCSFIVASIGFECEISNVAICLNYEHFVNTQVSISLILINHTIDYIIILSLTRSCLLNHYTKSLRNDLFSLFLFQISVFNVILKNKIISYRHSYYVWLCVVF